MAGGEPQQEAFALENDDGNLEKAELGLYAGREGTPLVVSQQSTSAGFLQGHRENIVQIAFEKHEAPRLHVSVEPVFALVGHGLYTGIAANVGLDHYSLMPV